MLGGRTRLSVQAGAKSRQTPTDGRGITEILVADRPNLKKEDFLSEAEVAAIANIKSNEPGRKYAALDVKNNSIFSTPTQANTMSFLEGHTTGSTMT